MSTALRVLSNGDGERQRLLTQHIAGLEKGETISQVELIGFLGLDPEKNCKDYAIACMQLVGRIIGSFKERNDPATVHMDHGSIRICTETQADIYNDRAFASAHDKQKRAVRRHMDIKESGLSDEARAVHPHKVICMQRYLQETERSIKRDKLQRSLLSSSLSLPLPNPRRPEEE